MSVNNFAAIPEELRSLIIERFRYNPKTGKLYFKKRFFTNPSPRNKQWNTRFAGKEAGFLNTNGYFRVSMNGKFYYVHQIAFVIMKGYLPKEIDHRDKNKKNNKWKNLREANDSQNSSNVFKRIINKSGLKGVSWAKSNNCWRMDITYNKVRYYSYHSSKKEAYKAYCKMSAKFHKEFGCAK